MVRIPSIQECLGLMDEYDMPEHIKTHSFKVRDVSVFLAKELNKKGKKLNVRLIEASALLHDLVKIHCVNSEKRHDKYGAKVLRSKGYKRIADIVEQHINLRKKYKRLNEEELVFYADKRVMHENIVGLPERFEDIKGRYTVESGNISFTEKESYRVEKKIFKNLAFSPNDLAALIK